MRSLKEKRASCGTKRMRASAALVDELMDEGDEHCQGSEQPLDHGPAAPEPPIGPPQTQSGNDPSTQKRRQVHKHRSVRLHRRQLTSRCFWSLAGQDICIIVSYCRVNFSVSQYFTCYSWRVTTFDLICMGDPSHDAGLKHDDADDGQHHEPGVDIDDDVLGANGEHVTHVDDIVEETVAMDVTLQSNDAEGEHLPPTDAFLDAAAGAIVLYHGSTPDAVEIRSSSSKSSTVHHGAAEISNPTERARLKMASKYMASPFVDPLVTRRDVRNKIVKDYEAFKKEESARRNVDILGDQGADFFITLEDPNKEMTKDAQATMQIPNGLWGYVEGERPTYAKKWEDVDFILAPCNVGGHWVVTKIDLVRWMIKVVDSARTSVAKDNGVRAGQMTPLTTMMPFICHQAGYFNNIRRKRQDLTSMPLDIHLPKVKVHR
ncbi:Ulp1 protease family [Theobroma cacao]|nr:Ulp1 protease family [Theobroma cacao]